ncbi:isoaspartyl peptidase/L-asparaginase [Polyangium mundeleinium]|uniref:Isoaspartyl peptidase/L-asparaginase n=1 Tax=Polyangium mundeleinium TaxID=2995306 RepID=A0ABT5ENT8_9BACT|nr:isoaspartyl peptidase/L-asparaginase [Polyangium mundeleinium]MDC0743494.1 isoaspartyl peptidase/L-asparaginase [Polyangium mundeleinium]
MSEPIVSQGGFLGRFGVVVHGGAGNVKPERRAKHAEGCLRAARAGLEVLRQGGSALDAVERAARALEDDTLFNAGTGACLDEEGRVAHDASIMEGHGLAAGAVCDLRGFANPISIARAALDDGRHVLYASEGAARFARARGFVPVGDEALVTEAAREALAAAREGAAPMGWAGNTIGAVALDGHRLLAAATSTGGMVNKRVGRVGDSPIIGAGTYADDEAGAVSTTGHGEGMIRLCIARTAVEHMRGGVAAEEAVRRSIEHLRARIGSTGGAIAIDPRGNYGLSRSTASMSWAATWAEGEASGF